MPQFQLRRPRGCAHEIDSIFDQMKNYSWGDVSLDSSFCLGAHFTYYIMNIGISRE